MLQKSTTKTKRNITSISRRKNNKVTFAVIAAMAVALSLAVLPALTNQAFAKIASVDTGSENPAGKAAPGQQPTATGGAQTQMRELQTPSGESLPILELTTSALG